MGGPVEEPDPPLLSPAVLLSRCSWAEPNEKPEGKRTSTASPERPTPWKEQVGEGWRVDAEGVTQKAQAERV